MISRAIDLVRVQYDRKYCLAFVNVIIKLDIANLELNLIEATLIYFQKVDAMQVQKQEFLPLSQAIFADESNVEVF